MKKLSLIMLMSFVVSVVVGSDVVEIKPDIKKCADLVAAYKSATLECGHHFFSDETMQEIAVACMGSDSRDGSKSKHNQTVFVGNLKMHVDRALREQETNRYMHHIEVRNKLSANEHKYLYRMLGERFGEAKNKSIDPKN